MSGLAWTMAAFIAACLLAAVVYATAWRKQRTVRHRRNTTPRRLRTGGKFRNRDHRAPKDDRHNGGPK